MRGRFLDGLVPADDLPFVLAALAGTPKRMQHAAGAVHGVQLVEALDAQASATYRRVGVAFQLYDDAVLQMRDSRAHLDAAVAGRLHPHETLVGAAAGRGLLLRSLLHTAGHRSAERRRRAHQSGRLDEASTCQRGFSHVLQPFSL